MTSFEDPEPLPAVEAEEPAPRTLLLRARGEFDEALGAQLMALLGDELDGPWFSRILLDLSRVTSLATDGLPVLQALRRRCRMENRHLVLIGAGCPGVHRTLRSSGLLPLFDIRPTVQATLQGSGRSVRRTVAG
jgi:anti-anti-sigma factor